MFKYQRFYDVLQQCGFTTIKRPADAYPENNAQIYVPVEVTGEKGKTVFTAANRNPQTHLFWHLDDNY